MPSSAWDDYFEALDEYLESVRVAIAVGRSATVPARLASRPSGPVPDEYQAKVQSSTAAVSALIDTAERRRDDVAGRLRVIRRPDRAPRRSHLLDCEL